MEHGHRPGAPEGTGTARPGHVLGQAPGDGRHRVQLGPAVEPLAARVRPGLLRDRDDLHGVEPVRHRAVRRRGVPGLAPPGRRDDRLGHRHQDDDADDRPALRPDARAQVRDLDGRLRHRRRPVQGGLQRRLRDRQVPPGRRLHPRLPADPAGTAQRPDHAPEEDRRRAARHPGAGQAGQHPLVSQGRRARRPRPGPRPRPDRPADGRGDRREDGAGPGRGPRGDPGQAHQDPRPPARARGLDRRRARDRPRPRRGQGAEQDRPDPRQVPGRGRARRDEGRGRPRAGRAGRQARQESQAGRGPAQPRLARRRATPRAGRPDQRRLRRRHRRHRPGRPARRARQARRGRPLPPRREPDPLRLPGQPPERPLRGLHRGQLPPRQHDQPRLADRAAGPDRRGRGPGARSPPSSASSAGPTSRSAKSST